MYLTAAHFQPASNLVAPDGSATDWTVCSVNAFVAVIPRDAASTAFVTKQNKFKSLIPADIYVGPYRIHGKVWSPNKLDDGLGFLERDSRFVVQDVKIDCLLPGAKLQGFEAPFAVIRTHLLQCATVSQ